MYYNSVALNLDLTQYPAVIDTGSSQFSVPSNVFKALITAWQKDLASLQCNQGQCATREDCSIASAKLGLVGLLMNEHVFELKADTYLWQGSDGSCSLLIHENNLPDDAANLYLVGDTFLAHFY